MTTKARFAKVAAASAASIALMLGFTATADAAPAVPSSMQTSCAPMPVNPAWQGLITLCQRASSVFGPGEVALSNTSPWVLRVYPAVGHRISVERRTSSTALRDVFTDELTRTTGTAADGSVLVGPGATALYSSGAASGVTLRIDSSYTAAKYPIEAFGGWFEGKLTPPRQALQNAVLDCGMAVGDTWSSTQNRAPLENVLIKSIQSSAKCRSAAKALKELESGPKPMNATDEVVSVTKSLGKSLLADVAKYGPRVLARH